jgi:uncharacterized membrane protein
VAHERGLERIVNLTDAVVAIAATLLVLPLVDLAGEAQRGHVGDLISDNGDKLFAFVLSFVVIARFWVVHQRIYRNIGAYVPMLVWANFVWLLGIVFIPFPTELVGTRGASDATSSALYVGTLALTTIAAAAQQIIIVRRPELEHESVRGSLSSENSLASAGSMVLAVILTVLIPSVGLWSLLLLVAADPTANVIRRLRARGPAPAA